MAQAGWLCSLDAAPELRRSLRLEDQGASLETAAIPAEQQIDYDQTQDETKAAAAVVSDARTHVIPTATKQENQYQQNKNDRHGQKCNTRKLR